MKYTLRHLQIFLCIAKYQSISRASDDLAMSPSATSSALQEFENRYQMKLFERNGKRLRLNTFGETIRIKAEALVAHATEFEHSLMMQEEQGHLRLGASLTIGNYLALKHLAKYMEHYPKAKVAMTVASTPEIVEKALNFEIDIGLIEAEVHHEDLILTPWQDDKMVIFCRSDHPFAQTPTLSDEQILQAQWVLREPDSGHRQTFDRSMHGLLPNLNITLELTHNEAIKNAVKAGLGIGCLSEIAIVDDIAQGSLKVLHIPKRQMNRRFYFVQHRGVKLNPAVHKWIQLCQNQT